MTKKTRLFLFISAGILVLGLGTGLLASYMGIQNLTLIGGGGPAEFAYVPSDATAVGFANVRAVMDSELRRKLTELHPDAGHADQFQERTGINIETDIDSVVAALVAGTEKSTPLVLARGRFDQVRLEGLAREEGGVVEDYNGIRLITHNDFAVAFVEPGVVALGPPAIVRRAIDTKAAGTGNIQSNDDLANLVRDVQDGNVWGVARFDALAGTQLPADVASRLPAISWVSMKGLINGGIEGQIRVEARDDTAAQDLRQVVQGFLALARMQAGQNPEIAEFMNALQLTGEGKTVSLSFHIPSAMIDVLNALRAGSRSIEPETAPDAPETQEAPTGPAPPAL